MPYYESSRVTLIAAEAIARASFVKLEADGLKACGAADTPIGFTELGAQNAGEHVCGQWRFSPDRAHFRPLRCRRGVTRGHHAYYQ